MTFYYSTVGWLGAMGDWRSRPGEKVLPYKGADGHPDLWGFGDGQKAFFWLKQGQPDPASIHWGFIAENNQAVDAFYKAAIAAGARTISRLVLVWNIIPAITPRTCLIRMATRLKWFTRASFN